MKRTGLSLFISAISIRAAAITTPHLAASEVVYPLNNTVFNLHLIILILASLVWAVFCGWCIVSLLTWYKKNHTTKLHKKDTLIWLLLSITTGVALFGITGTVVHSWKRHNPPALEIRISAYHWPDRYDYSWESPHGEKMHFQTNQPIVVQQNQAAHIALNAHISNASWFLSPWAKEHELLPGFWHQSNIHPTHTGRFLIRCVQNCGVDYGFVPLYVNVLNASDYATWQQQHRHQHSSPEPMLGFSQLFHEGRVVYQHNCAQCHQKKGGGMPNAVPALRQSPPQETHIAQQINWVLGGQPDRGMPQFASKLNDEAIAAVLDYIHHAWQSNPAKHTKTIQAYQVRALRSIPQQHTRDSVWL